MLKSNIRPKDIIKVIFKLEVIKKLKGGYQISLKFKESIQRIMIKTKRTLKLTKNTKQFPIKKQKIINKRITRVQIKRTKKSMQGYNVFSMQKMLIRLLRE